ncbi:hypothetical protein, partial [Rhodobacter viridis]|uniref:hypothetical protein n=1 Tax=Rhodobacter viridis TaxID=1054202 RepID=UPI001C651832
MTIPQSMALAAWRIEVNRRSIAARNHRKAFLPVVARRLRWSPASGQFAKLAAKEDEDEQRGWQTEELQR